MTDKEEKAIERCNQLIKVEHANWIGISNQKAIGTVLKELEKKDKIIDEIAGEIIRILYYCDGKVGKYKTPYVEESISKTHENIKEYFINKVEKERYEEIKEYI